MEINILLKQSVILASNSMFQGKTTKNCFASILVDVQSFNSSNSLSFKCTGTWWNIAHSISSIQLQKQEVTFREKTFTRLTLTKTKLGHPEGRSLTKNIWSLTASNYFRKELYLMVYRVVNMPLLLVISKVCECFLYIRKWCNLFWFCWKPVFVSIYNVRSTSRVF